MFEQKEEKPVETETQSAEVESAPAKIETIAKDEQKSAEVPSGESESADSKKELES
jgi:hypothetical protein